MGCNRKNYALFFFIIFYIDNYILNLFCQTKLKSNDIPEKIKRD